MDRFAKELTRVEIHLSDIDNKKTGRPDKRCLIEVRPAGDRPLAASAIATTTESAVDEALKKMKRLLTTFFGKKGRPATRDFGTCAEGKDDRSRSEEDRSEGDRSKESSSEEADQAQPARPQEKGHLSGPAKVMAQIEPSRS